MLLFPRLAERQSGRAHALGRRAAEVAMGRVPMGRPRIIVMERADDGSLRLFIDRALELIQTSTSRAWRSSWPSRTSIWRCSGELRLCSPAALSGPARDLLHDPRSRDAYLAGQAA